MDLTKQVRKLLGMPTVNVELNNNAETEEDIEETTLTESDIIVD